MNKFTNVVRNTSSCASYDIPSVNEYLKATNGYGITLLCFGALALIVVLLMFVDTLKYVIHNSSSSVKACTAFVIAVYPVSCLVSYLAILVPRSYLLAEALTQGMFMSGMYQLFCLFVAYCGGEAGLYEIVKPNKLSLEVGPCCCFPCCSFLPKLDVKQNTIKYLKLSVLQLPLVQGLVYVILLVMWAEAESLFQVNYMYLQPIIIVSILSGIWGISITINLLKESLNPQFLLLHKFFVLQMVLLFAKFQGVITRALVWSGSLPCNPPITPQVYAIIIHNTLMIMEMVILGCCARKLYKRQLPVVECRSSSDTGIISTLGSIIPTISTTFNDKLDIKSEGYANIGFEASS